MSEWKTYKLESVGRIITGKTPPTADTENFGTTYPFITPRDMNGQKNIFITERYLSEKGKILLKNNLLPKKSICVSCIGSDLGKVVMTTQLSLTNQQINSIVCNENFDNDFIYYSSLLISNAISNIGKSSTAVPIVNKSQFADFEIEAPDLSIQKLIASILSSLDDKIELNLQMNQTLEIIAQTIFKEWFINFNFPGFDGELINGLPKGWSYKIIKDLGKVVTGNTPSSNNPEYFGEITPFITPTDFKNFGKLIIDADRCLSIQGTIALRTRLLPKNSIIVTCIGSDMGKVALNRVECITNQQINSIIPDETVITADYIYYDLLLKYEYLRNIATGGSTMPIINKSRFEQIEVLVPALDVVKKFQLVIDGFNEKIEDNIRQINVLTELRDNLLPKLMTGKIEVNA